uniref:Uncharacterized protein n=1 Tax=Anguilla anguilla TaxID=7936 RepID=A0A0E9WJY9_ANGAN
MDKFYATYLIFIFKDIFILYSIYPNLDNPSIQRSILLQHCRIFCQLS